MKRGTLLHTVLSKALYIECRSCGHGKSILVSELGERLLGTATVGDVLDRAKCSKCGSKEIGEVRLEAAKSSAFDVDDVELPAIAPRG